MSFNPVPTSVVWNWRENLQASFLKYAVADIAARKRIADIRRYEQTHYPEKWKEPPLTIQVGGEEFITEDACALQWYNGPGGAAEQPGLEEGGKEYMATYCVIFDRDSGAWTYNPNMNRYVEKIGHEVSN